MVADDLVLLYELGVLVQPVRETLVQVRPRRLRKPFVRGVADQQVAEAEGVVSGDARPVGPDELLADEGHEPAWHVQGECLRRESRDGTAVEHLALDRSPLDHRALPLVERVEARLEKRLDRGRHVHRAPRLPRERGHLLEEQRVPLGGRQDASPRLVVEVDAHEKLVGFLVAQRLEQDRRRVGRST